MDPRDYLPERRIYYSGLLIFMAVVMTIAGHVDVGILNAIAAVWMKLK